MTYQIQPYNNRYQAIWDDFVLNDSANGNVFHTQSFLNYHPENRFEEASIFVYKDEKLVCVLAACKTENGFFSHLGTSCGGPVFHKDFYKAQEVYQIIHLVQKHYQNKLSIRLCESSLTPKGNDLLLFFLQKTHNILPELSIQIPISSVSTENILRTTKAQKQAQRVLKKNFLFESTDQKKDYQSFHAELSKNLQKYQTSPTHSLEELLTLKKILKKRQMLFLAKDSYGMIHGGVWAIRCLENIWHTQYIVKNYESPCADITLTLLFQLVEKLKNQDTTTLSLGPSTEQQGAVLNKSLIQFKEKLHHRHENRYILIPKKTPSLIQLK